MPGKSKFELVTPLQLLCSQDVDMVVIPGIDGEIGAMSNHTPLLTILLRGSIKLYDNGLLSKKIIINGGIAEIANNKVTVLSENVELANSDNKKIVEKKLINAKNNQQANKNEKSSELTDVDFYEFVLKNIN